MDDEIKIDVNVYIEKRILDKLEIITSEFDKELSCFLLGKVIEDGILIDDVLFPKQSVSGASFDIDKRDVLKLRKENEDKWGKILGIWHSHLSMGTFWSQGSDADESHIKSLSNHKDFSVFIVSSHNNNDYNNHRVRIEIQKPFKMSIDNLPLYVMDEQRDKLKENVLKDIEKIVVKDEPVVTYNNVEKKYKSGEIGYFYEQGQLIVQNLSFDDEQKILESDLSVIGSGIQKNGLWYVRLNAGNKNIAYSLKKEIMELLDKEKDADLNNFVNKNRNGGFYYGY